jgi:hypothetical protein
MRKKLAFLLCVICLGACVKPVKENTAATDSLSVDPETLKNSIYQRMDSVFQIDGKTFAVNVLQYDFTDIATGRGDTLGRPTYACVVKITDANKKVVFADSLLRDSWGYPGKIKPIEAYILIMPEVFSFKENEIVLPFTVYEDQSSDAILGSVAFNIQTLKSRYFWEERLLDN